MKGRGVTEKYSNCKHTVQMNNLKSHGSFWQTLSALKLFEKETRKSEGINSSLESKHILKIYACENYVNKKMHPKDLL